MNNISLYYFVIVAEELNITRAANKLFITQQSLSEHIKKLEKQYNATFFERGARLRLTYQGERMLTYAREVLDAEQELMENLRDGNVAGRVRMPVGLTSSRGGVFMPTIFANFHRQCPNVVLSIVAGNQAFIENQLRLGKLELYMGMTDNMKGRGRGEVLYRDRLYFIISRELLRRTLGEDAGQFPLDHREGISVRDACRFPIALPPKHSTLRVVFERVFTEHSLLPNAILETVDHDILFEVCQNGLCGCFVSREMLYREIVRKNRPANMLILPVTGIGELSSFELVYWDHMSNYATQFVACCRDTIAETIPEIDRRLAQVSALSLQPPE